MNTPRHTKYVVVFPEDPMTMIGPHDNALFHNMEDMKNAFRPLAKKVFFLDKRLIIVDGADYEIIGQIHEVKSYL
jgi:hypothetical protein